MVQKHRQASPRRAGAALPAVAVPDADAATALASLPNLGPKSAAFLLAAGIRTREDLAALGAVAAFVRVKQVQPKASLNLLWALDGALSGLHWGLVAREHRTSLLLALEHYQQQDTDRRSG